MEADDEDRARDDWDDPVGIKGFIGFESTSNEDMLKQVIDWFRSETDEPAVFVSEDVCISNCELCGDKENMNAGENAENCMPKS